MNQLKTTFAIIVLAGVLYGVYVTLNTPAPSASNSAQQLGGIQPPSIDFGPANQSPSLTGPGEPTVDLPPFENLNVVKPAANNVEVNPPPSGATADYVAPDLRTTNDPTTPAIETPPTDPPSFSPPTTELASPDPAPPTDARPNPPSSSYTNPKLETYKLKEAWRAVDLHVKDGKLREALAELSPFAANSHLAPEDRQQVLTWLDALAGKVIYGPEHYLSPPFKVTNRGQTLYDVSNAHKVPVQLLQNINSHQVNDPSVLLPGTELKVIPGPFRADVNLATGELTLYVGELYAGRFAFTIGDERPQPGTYRVQEKQKNRTYIGRDGRQIAGGDPTNPYGNCWIDLGKDVSLHGSGISNGQGPALGCLSFSPQDAQDLCGILSVTSEVVIK